MNGGTISSTSGEGAPYLPHLAADASEGVSVLLNRSGQPGDDSPSIAVLSMVICKRASVMDHVSKVKPWVQDVGKNRVGLNILDFHPKSEPVRGGSNACEPELSMEPSG